MFVHAVRHCQHPSSRWPHPALAWPAGSSFCLPCTLHGTGAAQRSAAHNTAQHPPAIRARSGRASRSTRSHLALILGRPFLVWRQTAGKLAELRKGCRVGQGRVLAFGERKALGALLPMATRSRHRASVAHSHCKLPRAPLLFHAPCPYTPTHPPAHTCTMPLHPHPPTHTRTRTPTPTHI